MTETEYVLSRFEQKFKVHLGKRIVLHGSRNYAEAIIERFDSVFHFAGIMSRDPFPDSEFHGLPVLQETEIPALDIDLIILTERVKYAEAIYQAIHETCVASGVLLYNMYGLDECETHCSLERCRPLSLEGWKTLCRPYQVIAFEVMDTLFRWKYYSRELALRENLRDLACWLAAQGVDVRFSLRKSAPEELQLELLRQAIPFPELEKHLIRRAGEDLSFRMLREENPGKRILYIGTGLVNECLLPRCYDIDTYRYQSMFNYTPYMPVGEDLPRQTFDVRKEEKLRQKIRACDQLSFDVFDTLLQRKTLFPRDVFALAERRGKDKGFSVNGFADARAEAESQLYAPDIDAIYERMRENTGWDLSLIQAMKRLELEAERAVLVPRTEVAELFNYALREGKRVVLVSDMYLPSSFLAEILEENGISGYEKLYVSCEYGRTKADGLFELVFPLRHDGLALLHIGDNPEADEEICKPLGIEPVLLPSAFSLAVAGGWRDAILSASSLQERCLVGMAVAELFRSPFQNPNIKELPQEVRYRRFAVSAVAPLVTGYMTWLIAKLKEQRFDGVLFFARDGYLPMRIYLALDFSASLPPALYYYATRRSTFLTSADDPKLIPMIVDMGVHAGLGPQEILQSYYNLNENEILPQEAGESLSEYISRHSPIISEVAESARAGYRCYSERLGLKRNGRYAVVDFIARGTSQMFLERFLPYRLSGLYFGNENPDDRPDCEISDYLRGTENSTLLKNFIELESFFISPEASVDHLSSDGEVFFAGEVRTQEELAGMNLVHECAFRFAKEFFSLFYEDNEVVDAAVPAEMFAADGYHWVQNSAFDDWARRKIAAKAWQNGPGLHEDGRRATTDKGACQ